MGKKDERRIRERQQSDRNFKVLRGGKTIIVSSSDKAPKSND